MSFERLDLSDRKRPGGRNALMVYGFGGFSVDLLIGFQKSAGIDELIIVDNTRAKMHIKNIVGDIKDNEGVEYKNEKNQVLLFHGTSQYELQTVLGQLSKLGKNRPLVAMTTPTSLEWTFESLIAELKDERASLS